jgi:hypothetical protein
MKKPIKINTNRAPLTSDEIKKHQNFKQTWQKQYAKPKPFYKNPKFFGGLILILITAVVVVLEYYEKREDHTQSINIEKTKSNNALKLDTIEQLPSKSDSTASQIENNK